MNVQQNCNTENYFIPNFHQLNARLTSSLPVEGKLYELAKRIALLAVYPFVTILALFESVCSLIQRIVTRRETISPHTPGEEAPRMEEQSSADELFRSEEFRIAVEGLRFEMQRTEELIRLGEQRKVEEQLRTEEQRRLEEQRKAEELLRVFDFVSLPEDLKILVLSYCAPDVKCQLVFVSTFTKEKVQFDAAMHKMLRALDWILVHPDLMENLNNNSRGRQSLIDYLLCDITPWENKSPDFLKNVFNIFFTFGTDEEIAGFMLMITKDLSYHKSLKILFGELSDERFERLLLFPKCEDFLIPICSAGPKLSHNVYKKIAVLYQKVPNSNWWNDIKQAGAKSKSFAVLNPVHLSRGYCDELRWLDALIFLCELMHKLEDEESTANDTHEKANELCTHISSHWARANGVWNNVLRLMLKTCMEKKLGEEKIIKLVNAFIGHEYSTTFIMLSMMPKFKIYPVLMEEFLPKIVDIDESQDDLRVIIESIKEEEQAICYIKTSENLTPELSRIYLRALAHGLKLDKSSFDEMESAFTQCGLNIELYPKLAESSCNPFLSIRDCLEKERKIQRKIDKQKAKEEDLTRLQEQELEIARLKEQLASTQ